MLQNRAYLIASLIRDESEKWGALIRSAAITTE